MLAAEAVRLMAVETLLPTAALLAGGPYPTLAGKRVFDSAAPSISDIDETKDYTPVISVYTPESGSKARSSAAEWTDRDADCALDIVAELVTIVREDGKDYAEPMADGDASARLVLAALASQIRRTLMLSMQGSAWRGLVRSVTDVEYKTVAVPEFGLRLQRLVTRFHLEIADDRFDLQSGGLPEPIRSVYEALPVGSYAKQKLAELQAAFIGEPLVPLQEIRGETSAGEAGFGPTFP